MFACNLPEAAPLHISGVLSSLDDAMNFKYFWDDAVEEYGDGRVAFVGFWLTRQGGNCGVSSSLSPLWRGLSAGQVLQTTVTASKSSPCYALHTNSPKR